MKKNNNLNSKISIDTRSFVKTEYLKEPTSFFSLAYFKYLELLDKATISLKTPSDDAYQLTIETDNVCYLFKNKHCNLPFSYEKLYNKIILNDDTYNQVTKRNKMIYLYEDELYVKAVCNLSNILNTTTLDQSLYREFDHNNNTQLFNACKLINDCYTDISIDDKTLLDYFTNSKNKIARGLFLYNTTNDIIGFILTIQDLEINELSIEWLQILPDYQNKGLGKALVHQALIRSNISTFAVVCFKKQDSLISFYRNCGFTNFTIWHVLSFTPRLQITNDSTLSKKIFEIKQTNIKPKLLIHSCCGPCSSYVIEYLKCYFDITIYYYNPNIYPEEEYIKRLTTQDEIARYLLSDLALIKGEYNYALYEQQINLATQNKRCYNCYYMRLEQTAIYAKANSFDYFTTTLSISPHKNSDWINEIGKLLSNKYSVNFLYSNFKLHDGYKKSIALSKKYSLYRQNYCGCKWSIKTKQTD